MRSVGIMEPGGRHALVTNRYADLVDVIGVTTHEQLRAMPVGTAPHGTGPRPPSPTSAARLARGRLAASAPALWLLLRAAPAWADHPMPGMRTAAWDPLTAALVFGGLSVVAGLLVVVVVALLTRRPPRDDAGN